MTAASDDATVARVESESATIEGATSIEAAVVRERGGAFAIESAVLAPPVAGEVLVDIKAVGLCHTDLSVIEQLLPMPLPAVLGHEGAGIVAAIGDSVTKVAVGDKVSLTFASCGGCRQCARGQPAYCAEFFPRNLSGTRADGTTTLTDGAGDVVHGSYFGQSSFATKALATERNVVRLPNDADLSVCAPLACGFQTGAGTILNRLRPAAGASLVVFGAGAVGLAALLAAKDRGCDPLIAVDLHDERLALARALGATHTINAKSVDDVVAAIRAIVVHGADFTVEATGSAAVAQQAVYALAPLGTCALVGFGPPGTTLDVQLAFLLATGASVVGVSEGDSQPDELIPMLYDLYRQGRFAVDRLIRTYAFRDINDAVADAAAGRTVKPVLLME